MCRIKIFTEIATCFLFLQITPAMFSAQTEQTDEHSQAKSGVVVAQKITSLLTQLRDTNYLVRRNAIDELAQIGSPAVEALIRALSDENRSVRYSAAETLGQIGAAGQMGQHQKDAVLALKKALEDDDWLVHQRAKESLKQIDSSSAMATRVGLEKNTPATRQDLGTGVIVDSRGYILTAAHVVAPPYQVEVTIGHQSYQATVHAVDVQHDLALLKISATGLPTVRIGDANAVERQEKRINT